MNREELAWAAGFFDGEGSTYVHRSSPHAPKKRTPKVRLSIGQNDPEVLLRFRDAVGHGVVYGPYARDYSGGVKIHWRYRTNDPSDALTVIKLLWPWLGSKKKAQAKLAWKRVKAWQVQKLA